MVWEAEHIQRGVRVRIQKRNVATIMQMSWELSDDLDMFVLVSVSNNVALPHVAKRTELAAYLNDQNFFLADE